jgi:antitoxin MazE
MTVNIRKWGNSQGIRIPKHMLDDLAWSETETVDISIDDGKIIIERFRASERKNIKELFEGFKGKYEPEDIDWGEPSGGEVW